MNINPLHDAETLRQQRNLTTSQRRNNLTTKEGVLVNNLVKDKNCSLDSTKNTYIISDNTSMPETLYQDNKIIDKKLLPLSAVVLGVMSTIAVVTGFARRSTRIAKDLPKEKWLPAVTRNVQLSKETHQLVYQFVQNPNKKNIYRGSRCFNTFCNGIYGKNILRRLQRYLDKT